MIAVLGRVAILVWRIFALLGCTKTRKPSPSLPPQPPPLPAALPLSSPLAHRRRPSQKEILRMIANGDRVLIVGALPYWLYILVTIEQTIRRNPVIHDPVSFGFGQVRICRICLHEYS